jgi:GNAT superfamily N-acetyltransferase
MNFAHMHELTSSSERQIKGDLRFEQIDVNSPLYPESLLLRDEVLREPLGLKWTDAERAEEACCVHIVGIAGTRVVATLLLKPMDTGNVKMRQVAVHPALQRAGIGSKLVAFAEETARAMGYRKICAHVRLSAVSFYRKAGYAMIGDPFVEVTIQHVLAIKEL